MGQLRRSSVAHAAAAGVGSSGRQKYTDGSGAHMAPVDSNEFSSLLQCGPCVLGIMSSDAHDTTVDLKSALQKI